MDLITTISINESLIVTFKMKEIPINRLPRSIPDTEIWNGNLIRKLFYGVLRCQSIRQ